MLLVHVLTMKNTDLTKGKAVVEQEKTSLAQLNATLADERTALSKANDELTQGKAAVEHERDLLTKRVDDLTKCLAGMEQQILVLQEPKKKHQRAFMLLGREDVEREAAGCYQPRIEMVLQDMDNASLLRAFVAGRLNGAPEHMSLSRVQLVCNTEEDEATFCSLFYKAAQQRAANPMLRPENRPTAQFTAGLEKLRDSCYAVGGMGSGESRLHANVVLAWHGTAADHVEDVCKHGARSFRTTDGGFFGAGSYFALESTYAMRYARLQPVNAAGEYGVILFAVHFSCAYVVTEADYTRTEAEDPARWGFSRFFGPTPHQAVALLPKYGAHFIPVRYCGYTHPFAGAVLPAGVHVDYQATDASIAAAHELVVQTHHQAIPLAVAWFK